MSTTATINYMIIEAVKCGQLKQFLPISFFGEQVKRGLYMPPELYDFFHKEPEGEDEKERLIFMRGLLDHFVSGGKIDNKFYMKRLYKLPLDIWEIKIYMVPEWRIFGMFALPDVFICSHIQARGALGKFESSQWASAKERADLLWQTLFPNMSRLKEQRFESYITSNGDHYDW